MKHILSLEGEHLSQLRELIFPKIASGETILFLGAGASVTDEKKYLSAEIMEYYSDKKGFRLETNDITDFVDTLSYKKDFDRDEFDSYVAEILRKYKVSEIHRTIAGAPWKEIITTNFDLLIESAFDEGLGTINEGLKYKAVRQLSEYSYRPANDEFKYVKLNGCLSDKKRYPLVFSKKDFENSKRFYTVVLKSLENLSPQINFLSVGYSFKDAFAKSLLERFDRTNFRSKKWLFNVDPFVENDRLDYFTENRICVIKSQAKDFFAAYKDWEQENAENYVARSTFLIKSKQNKSVNIPPRVRQRIDGHVIQLFDGNAFRRISPMDFYGGEQPNFQVIQDNLDVIKESSIAAAKAKIAELLEERKTIIPTLVLEGAYGAGKTTLTYRLINTLINDIEADCVAFEIIDPDILHVPDLEEIFSKSKAGTVILFFNGIELDTAFKGLIRLRNKLSIEQFNQYNLIFLASMRENILAQFLKEHEYRNFHKLAIDAVFSNDEASDLIDKLNTVNLVTYRDAKQKDQLVQKVINEYSGDTLVSLISLVAEGTHYQIIRDAYNQLEKNAQKVFLYTSLLYRFGILMPASLLRHLIEISWDDFIKDIVPYNFKNFIVQENRNTPGTDPDLYFRTRHPIISDKLVEICLPSEDSKFEKYEFLLRKLTYSSSSSDLIINLLKTLRHYEDLSDDKIDRLFDICGQEFHEDPYFNLHYATNLQYRNDERALRKGIQRITFAESFLEGRNHRLVHRKAVLNFHLAKLLFAKEGVELRETYKHIDNARSFFEIKLILDPFTSYSYVDFVYFEIWCLEHFVYDEIGTVRQKIKIEELLDQGEKLVFDDTAGIIKVKSYFLRQFKQRTEQEIEQYEKYLEKLSEDPQKRPYGLILSFYHYQEYPVMVNQIISELESFSYLDEAAKVLFRHYGRNLNLLANRLRFADIVRKHPFIEKKDSIRFNYYSYLNEAYNGHFDSAFEYIGNIKTSFGYLNPELQNVWKEIDGDTPRIFGGYIFTKNNKWKKIKIPELQRSFDVDVETAKKIDLTDDSWQEVNLYFYLTGIKARILPKTEEDSEKPE